MPINSRCPLCGARLPATAWFDACNELLDAGLGILAARCPICQGNLEIRPQPGRLELGYRSADGKRFDVARQIDLSGLAVETTGNCLILRVDGQQREFSEA